MAFEAPPDVLSPEQRDQIGDFLAAPIKYPSEFKQWLSDYLSMNVPAIPVSQLMGYKPTLAHNEIVLDQEAITTPERTWVDGAAPGPTVSGLADGLYFCSWGALVSRGGTGAAHCRVGPSVNDADPSGVNYAEGENVDPDLMVWKSAIVEAKNGTDNNEIKLKYWVDLAGGASGDFAYRWLTVMRVT